MTWVEIYAIMSKLQRFSPVWLLTESLRENIFGMTDIEGQSSPHSAARNPRPWVYVVCRIDAST